MKLIRRIALVLILAAGLVGCKLDLPSLTSGSVQRFEKGTPVLSRQLSEKQLLALSAWFQQRRSGWSRSYVTFVPKTEVHVMHSDGKQSSINIWPQQVIVVTEEHQLVQDFGATDMQTLFSIMGQ